LILHGKDARFWLTISRLTDYLVYLKEIEESVEEKKVFIEKQGKSVIGEDGDTEDYWYHFGEEYDKYASVFPTILFNYIQ
jgi:hypothetical protein